LSFAALFSSNPRAWPAGIGAGQVLLELVRFELTFAVLGAVAGWRTWVHARRFAAGQSSGWTGIAEAALCGLIVAILVLAPGIVTRPREAPPYVVFYGGVAFMLGGAVGVVLYGVARVILRSPKSTAG
jgi:hypothetical protein